MPKHEIIHPAGHPLQSDLKQNLLPYFKDSELQRLERLGGRILVSITAPYTNRKKKNRKAINIDHEFVKQIESLKNSPDKIQEVLNNLTIKELRKLGGLFGQPIRSNANAGEIRSELIRYLQSEDVWHRISGTARKVS